MSIFIFLIVKKLEELEEYFLIIKKKTGKKILVLYVMLGLHSKEYLEKL